MGDLYILVNIGCIECDVSSDIVGIFPKDRALELQVQLCKEASWRDGGQNDFQIYPMPQVGVINPEYCEYLNEEDSNA